MFLRKAAQAQERVLFGNTDDIAGRGVIAYYHKTLSYSPTFMADTCGWKTILKSYALNLNSAGTHTFLVRFFDL